MICLKNDRTNVVSTPMIASLSGGTGSPDAAVQKRGRVCAGIPDVSHPGSDGSFRSMYHSDPCTMGIRKHVAMLVGRRHRNVDPKRSRRGLMRGGWGRERRERGGWLVLRASPKELPSSLRAGRRDDTAGRWWFVLACSQDPDMLRSAHAK